MDFNEIVRWVVSRGLTLLVGVAVLLLAYRAGVTAIHRAVPQLLRAQAAHLPSATGSADEVDKRIATIEDLLSRLLRVTILALLVALVLAVFDLWSILAGIVLVVVALLFATQDVVLDYVMGFLILVEGPFFKGDWIRVGAPGGVEGTVEEIGLRRTLLRDGLGSMHAISNGLIRQSSNVTRVFSVATVEVQVLHAADLDAAMDGGDAGRPGDARGRRLVGPVRCGRAARRLGHRPHDRWRHAAPAAAGLDRHARAGGERAAPASRGGAGGRVHRDGPLGHGDAHRDRAREAARPPDRASPRPRGRSSPPARAQRLSIAASRS